MKKRLIVGAIASLIACGLTCGVTAQAADLQRPKAGKVEIFPLKDVKPGMQAIAWTVFSGTEAGAGAGRDHRRLAGQSDRAGRHSRQDGRQGERNQRRRGHERQPGVYRRQSWLARWRCASACFRPTRSAASRRSSRCSRFRISISRVRPTRARRTRFRPSEPPTSKFPARLLGRYGFRGRAGIHARLAYRP